MHTGQRQRRDRPVGKVITFTLCGDFASGPPVTVTVNGVAALTKTASNGAVVVVLTVQSQTVLAVGDPVNVAAICGVNIVVATGPPIGWGTVVPSTGTLTLQCTSSTTTSGPLALTGANVLMAVLIAFALIVLGAMLVVFKRRRRQTI